MKKALIILIVLLGILSNGCSTVPTFRYRFYYVDIPTSTLLGATAKDDLPLSNCQDPKIVGHACVVMFKSDFKQLYQDYLEK